MSSNTRTNLHFNECGGRMVLVAKGRLIFCFQWIVPSSMEQNLSFAYPKEFEMHSLTTCLDL